jgi:uncharacterized protein YegL
MSLSFFERAQSSEMISITQSPDSASDSILLTISNNFQGTNIKKRLVLVLDVSGSMNGERINLVLHAVKVILTSCHQDIQISIYTFDSIVTQIQEFIVMNDQNKATILELVPNIPLTFGSTNLLDGINEPLKYVQSVNDPTIDTHILVFTDGEPNIKDIFQYNSILDKYYKDSGLPNVIIDIFGFGNSLNQDIMKLIYQRGKGQFGFISDPNMLATVFNNYIANLFSTPIKNVVLSYEIEGSTDFIHVELGDMIAQQERHVILHTKQIDFASLTYTNLLLCEKVTLRFDTIPIVQQSTTKFHYHNLRLKLCNVIKDVNTRSLEALYREYSVLLSDSNRSSEDYQKLKNLLDDIIHSDPNKGQIQKAFTNYHTWGKYYLMSLLQSHCDEKTINFKDESIQNYSGPIASSIAISLNDTFASIPLVMTYGQSRGYSMQYYAPVSAASYVDRSGGCFIGTSQIKIFKNNSVHLINLHDLKCGDILYSKDSNLVVKHILKIQISREEVLYKYSSLIGTANHPVKIDNKWMKMKDIGTKYFITEDSDIDFVYTISVYNTTRNIYVDNFILENIQCATIGHGHLDDQHDSSNILRSTFWGKTIIEVIEGMHLNENILTLYLGKHHYTRDTGTGWINNIVIEV